MASCIAGADEQRFLEASMAYVSGNPILSDKEFDELKQKLKVFRLLNCKSYLHETNYCLPLMFGFFKVSPFVNFQSFSIL